jgi:CrcB protein
VPPEEEAASAASAEIPVSESDRIVDSDVDLGDPAQLAEVAPREWDIVLAVAAGGVIGSLARYGLSRAVPHSVGTFPWSTVLINVTGCFAIGVLMVLLLEQAAPPRLARPLLGVGFLGGYTTYSTFATDVVGLLRDHRPAVAVGYLAASVLGCVVAVWLATISTKRLRSARR